MSIYKKILAVQAAVGRVAKTGFNSFHKYYYVTEADLMDALRPALIEQGLVIIMTGMEAETGFCTDGKRWAKAKLHYLIADADGKEQITTSTEGYAEDSFDKAIYKAETGAAKYLYYKLFMVSTGDDPEREEAPQPATSKAGNSKQTSFKKASEVATPKNPEVTKLKDLLLAAYNAASLTPEQAKEITGMSVKEAVEKADVAALTQAWNKVQEYLIKKGAA